MSKLKNKLLAGLLTLAMTLGLATAVPLAGTVWAWNDFNISTDGKTLTGYNGPEDQDNPYMGEDVCIPDGVETIKEGAFNAGEGDEGLGTITFPASITSINADEGTSSFLNVVIQKMLFLGNVPEAAYDEDSETFPFQATEVATVEAPYEYKDKAEALFDVEDGGGLSWGDGENFIWTYNVKYEFVSATEEKELPTDENFTKLLPEASAYAAKDENVTVATISDTTFETEEGTWTFDGWYDGETKVESTVVIVDKNINLVGQWSYEEKEEPEPEPTDHPKTAEELEMALENGLSPIIVSDSFETDRTFYVHQDTVIYSESEVTISRAAEFAGSMFIVGTDKSGEIINEKVELSLGTDEETTTKNLIIDGNKSNVTATVTGTGISVLSNAKVTMYSDVQMQNHSIPSETSNGGAMNVKGTVVLKGATFTGNYAGKSGGALFVNGGVAVIDNCNFSNNSCGSNGGAIEIYSSSIMTIRETEFFQNTATDNAGAIYNSGSLLTIYDSSFQENQSSKCGGALCLLSEGTTKVYSSEFKNNTAGTNGGVAYVYTGESGTMVTNTVFNECDFIENSATNYGGVVYISNVSQLGLYNIKAEKNSAGSGGFMYETTTGTTVTLNGISISQNTATNGPIIYGNSNGAILKIDKSHYTDNDVEGELPEDYWSSAIVNKLTVEEISAKIPEYPKEPEEPVEPTYYPANADQLESALDNGFSPIIISESFEADRTFYVPYDTVIYSESEATITRAAEFSGDMFVVGTDKNGEKVCETVNLILGTSDEAEFKTLIIDGNKDGVTDVVTGTGIYVCDNASVTMYADVQMQNHYTAGSGAAMVVSGAVTARGATFMNNEAERSGGAVYFYKAASAYLCGCEFNKNTAKAENDGNAGGAIYIAGESVTVNHCTFSENSSQTVGGAISLADGVNVTVNGTEFLKNNARSGGAVYNNNSVLTVYNSSFAENQSTGGGGAMYLGEGGVNSIYSSEFNKNTAGTNGGVAYVYTGAEALNSEFNSCSFMENSATNFGGVFYVSNASLLGLYNIEAEKNSAASGGFMYETKTSSIVTLNGISLSQNTATSGPIIYGNATGAILKIDKSHYTDKDVEGELPENYWASAIVSKLTVNEITADVPECPTYKDPEDYYALTYEAVEGGVKVTGITIISELPEGKLLSVVIPAEDEDGNKVIEIANEAFYGENAIKSITIGENVAKIGSGSFELMSSLKKFIVAEGNTAYEAIDGVLFSKDGKKLINYPDSKEITAYEIPDETEILAEEAFENSNVTTVTIPSSVTTLEDRVFYSCSSLEKVTMSANLEIMGTCTFSNCSSLSEVILPDTIKLTYVPEKTFWGCESLDEIRFPDVIRETKACAFGNCTDGLELDFVAKESLVTRNQFDNCSSDSQEEESYYTEVVVNYNVDGLYKDQVTFNVQGHGTAPDAQMVANGSLAVKPEDPAENCYIFEGWFKEDTCITAWDFDNDIVTADVTLYAKWSESHNYQGQEVIFTWNDYECELATIACSVCEKTQTAVPIVTSEVTAEPNCTDTGVRTYTATCSLLGNTYTGTKEEILPAIGHDYTDVTPTWKWDSSHKYAYAYFTCTKCGAIEKVKTTKITSKVTKAATCTKAGSTTYVAEVTFAGKTYNTSVVDKTVPAKTGHKYSYHICTVCGAIDYVETPTLKSATASSSYIKVTWGKVTDASYYQVYRKASGAKTWTMIGSPTSKTYYIDKTAKAGTWYSYTVKALNKKKAGISKYNGTGVSSIILAAPSKITGKEYSKYIRIGWSKVTGATGYRIYRKATGEKKYTLVSTTSKSSIRYYKDTKVTKGKTYTYYVVPIAKSGKTTVIGATKSKTVSVKRTK